MGYCQISTPCYVSFHLQISQLTDTSSTGHFSTIHASDNELTEPALLQWEKSLQLPMGVK